MSRPRLVFGAALAAALLVACSGGGSAATAATTAPSRTTAGTSGGGQATASATTAATATSAPAAATTTVHTAVYFLHSGKVSPAARTVTAPQTAAGALRALLAGPDAYERAHGRTTAIPSGTTLRSVAVRSRVATVDLSGRYDDGASGASARARLAQVVFTVTRFTGIDTVRFALDGRLVTVFGSAHIAVAHPVGRADFEAQSPAVLVESPLLGDTVTVGSPLRVRGTADTFEAVFRLRLTDRTGRVAADVRVKATSGTGTRGTFDVTVPLHAPVATGPGTLTAYVVSPEDGHRVTVETVPVTWGR
ncbi:Gmad2 immunoglobulin-like domain-containing protein [Streptomyces sp. NPDC051976]|uniref:Gmad2 immunoglobulin-like domain-containing protein n=1 Tax=Streptomyces sp. NPDC051976 TaxID=3154947 RepID=UPI00341F6EB4